MVQVYKVSSSSFSLHLVRFRLPRSQKILKYLSTMVPKHSKQRHIYIEHNFKRNYSECHHNHIDDHHHPHNRLPQHVRSYLSIHSNIFTEIIEHIEPTRESCGNPYDESNQMSQYKISKNFVEIYSVFNKILCQVLLLSTSDTWTPLGI